MLCSCCALALLAVQTKRSSELENCVQGLVRGVGVSAAYFSYCIDVLNFPVMSIGSR